MGDARPERADDVVAAVVDHVAEVVAVFDSAGHVLRVNAAVRRVLGFEPGDWVGRHGADLCHPDDISLGMELLVSAQATGPGVKEPVVYRMAHADGRWIDLECIASNVELASGELVLVVSGRPAHQVRPSTAIFDEAAERVSAMFDHAAIGMAQVSLDGRILRANVQFGVELLGRTVELRGARLADLVHLDDRYLVDGDGSALLRGEGLSERTLRLSAARPTGPSTARLTSSLVRDHAGEPMYYAVHASAPTAGA